MLHGSIRKQHSGDPNTTIIIMIWKDKTSMFNAYYVCSEIHDANIIFISCFSRRDGLSFEVKMTHSSYGHFYVQPMVII
jgi:hypothetical protein